jgi:hypothetical protein
VPKGKEITMQSQLDEVSDGVSQTLAVASAVAASPPYRRQALPPKGACWYCDRPLDSVRRFCGKDCAEAYDEEAELSG